MEKTVISKARVKCPGCARLFEFDDDNRGCVTKCPKCECDFLIPEEGTDGVLVGTGDDSFDIVCPHCHTEFVLPDEYRGEAADCAECHRVFLIPLEGKQGLPMEEEAVTAAPVAAAKAPTVPEPPPQQRRMATVFLSRKEVLDQAEKAQRERMERVAQPRGIQRAGGGGEPIASFSSGLGVPEPSNRGVIDLKTTATLEPAATRAVRRSELPDWMPPLDFEKREKIVEFEAGAEPALARIKVTTLIPVLLIPAAAILGHYMHPAAAIACTLVPGLVCWGLAAVKLLPVLGRKVIILTNFRVIMADANEVVDIDLL
jgi:hypothetical protein